jgi:hypothetical protein
VKEHGHSNKKKIVINKDIVVDFSLIDEPKTEVVDGLKRRL